MQGCSCSHSGSSSHWQGNACRGEMGSCSPGHAAQRAVWAELVLGIMHGDAHVKGARWTTTDVSWQWVLYVPRKILLGILISSSLLSVATDGKCEIKEQKEKRRTRVLVSLLVCQQRRRWPEVVRWRHVVVTPGHNVGALLCNISWNDQLAYNVIFFF